MYVYVTSGYVDGDDVPWFKVEGVTRTLDGKREHQADIIIIAGRSVITVLKNRFEFDMAVYKDTIILATTQFISTTLDCMKGWADRKEERASWPSSSSER